MLNDEELHDIGAPLTSLLETMIRQRQEEREADGSSSDRSGHVMGDSSVSDGRFSDAYSDRPDYIVSIV